MWPHCLGKYIYIIHYYIIILNHIIYIYTYIIIHLYLIYIYIYLQSISIGCGQLWKEWRVLLEYIGLIWMNGKDLHTVDQFWKCHHLWRTAICTTSSLPQKSLNPKAFQDVPSVWSVRSCLKAAMVQDRATLVLLRSVPQRLRGNKYIFEVSFSQSCMHIKENHSNTQYQKELNSNYCKNTMSKKCVESIRL